MGPKEYVNLLALRLCVQRAFGDLEERSYVFIIKTRLDLKSLSTLLQWSLEIIANVPQGYFQRLSLPSY